MKSIFMTMDKRFSKAKFWTSCYQIDSRIIFEKEIIEAVDLQRPSLIRLVLTQDYIYRHQNEKPLKRCNIK